MWLQSAAASSGRQNTPSGVAGRRPPDPILPPTAMLKPFTSSPAMILIAGVSDRSWVSPCVQFSVQPVIATLNLRGRFVNALFRRNASLNSRTTREASNSSSSRQTGDRTPDDVADVVHAGLQRHEVDRVQPLPDVRQIADGESAQLNLLPRREIDEASAAFAAQLGDGAELVGVREAVRHADPHHEAAGRLTPEEHAEPLQPLAVGFVNRLPSVAHESLDVGFDIEAVLLALVALDLVERDRRCCSGRTEVLRYRSRSPVTTRRPKSSGAVGLLDPLARERDDGLHFGPARAAARRRARGVADRLHAARTAQHRLDDLRFRHVVAVADARGVGRRRPRPRPARHRRCRREKQQLRAVLGQRQSRTRTSAAATARRRRRRG